MRTARGRRWPWGRGVANAVFAAGNDATGAYTVNFIGQSERGEYHGIEEGAVTVFWDQFWNDAGFRRRFASCAN